MANINKLEQEHIKSGNLRRWLLKLLTGTAALGGLGLATRHARGSAGKNSDGAAPTISRSELDRLLHLADRIEIEDVICGETMAGDLLDPAVATERYYTDDATVTFGKVEDPNRSAIPVTQYKKLIESFLPGFDARQHIMSNFIINIDGDNADSRSQVYAVVNIGEDVYETHGIYYHKLVRTPQGWRIRRQETDMRINIGDSMHERAIGLIKEKGLKMKDKSSM